MACVCLLQLRGGRAATRRRGSARRGRPATTHLSCRLLPALGIIERQAPLPQVGTQHRIGSSCGIKISQRALHIARLKPSHAPPHERPCIGRAPPTAPSGGGGGGGCQRRGEATGQQQATADGMGQQAAPVREHTHSGIGGGGSTGCPHRRQPARRPAPATRRRRCWRIASPAARHHQLLMPRAGCRPLRLATQASVREDRHFARWWSYRVVCQARLCF